MPASWSSPRGRTRSCTSAERPGKARSSPLALVSSPVRLRAVLALVTMAPLVAAAALLDPATAEYRGASGLAAALWAYAGIARAREPIGAAMLILLGTFLLRETFAGATLHDGWIACAAAHRTGALLGGLIALGACRGEEPSAGNNASAGETRARVDQQCRWSQYLY